MSDLENVEATISLYYDYSEEELRRAGYPRENGPFVVTFLNKIENNLTKTDVSYIFSKFGPLSDIRYTEHGRVYVSYKEKEGAEKVCEVLNTGTKYHVEITEKGKKF